MSGFDHFLSRIGAITLPEGTSADPIVSQVVKILSVRLDEMAKHSPSFAESQEMQTAKDAVREAEQFVAKHDYEKAYEHTILAALLVGHTAKSLESIKKLEALFDAAFKEAGAIRDR